MKKDNIIYQSQMDKSTHSQDEISKSLIKGITLTIEQINRLSDEIGVPKQGLSVPVGEIGFNGNKFDLIISLSPARK